VKLLFDENLSPRLASLPADVFPGSAHVFDCGLGNSADEEIWEYARAGGFTVVSRDSDFQERSILGERHPKLIWVRTSNSSSKEIASLLRAALPAILALDANEQETCLILSRFSDR
jgi:predicted nuclease of predicted toxin-antitoxin system